MSTLRSKGSKDQAKIREKMDTITKRIKAIKGRDEYLPVWLGADKRCFICGQKKVRIGLEQEFQTPQRPVYFVVCETCIPTVDPDHARRNYISKFQRWLDKVDRKNARGSGSAKLTSPAQTSSAAAEHHQRPPHPAANR